ncbi:MAG: hypothetical protein PUF72_09430 [Clostridiales bacterium]|nr:hypothetical protein [Clostridiales bacterium]
MDILDVAKNLNKTVYYKDFYNIRELTAYILNGCTVRKDPRGMLHYEAELLDKNKNSIIIAKLEAVRLNDKEFDNE